MLARGAACELEACGLMAEIDPLLAERIGGGVPFGPPGMTVLRRRRVRLHLIRIGSLGVRKHLPRK